MFEVQDLSQASPATVSRCGMVYVDAKTLGWTPYVKSWLNLLFDKVPLIREEFEEVILALFEKYVDPGLNFVRKFCATAIHQVSVFCSSFFFKVHSVKKKKKIHENFC
jgi:hypothetical protein